MTCKGPFSINNPSMLDDPGLPARRQINDYLFLQYHVGTYPPFSQIPHGVVVSSLADAVNEPCACSNAQKKSVSFGWPARLTGMFPAKLRLIGKVTFGSGSLTRKSTTTVNTCKFVEVVKLGEIRLTILPHWTKISSWFSRIIMRKCIRDVIIPLSRCQGR